MLSLVIYKNLFPEDYTLFLKGQGYLIDILESKEIAFESVMYYLLLKSKMNIGEFANNNIELEKVLLIVKKDLELKKDIKNMMI